MKITIVGLGTGPEDITLAGRKAVEASDYVLIKTSKSATYGFLRKTE